MAVIERSAIECGEYARIRVRGVVNIPVVVDAEMVLLKDSKGRYDVTEVVVSDFTEPYASDAEDIIREAIRVDPDAHELTRMALVMAWVAEDAGRSRS